MQELDRIEIEHDGTGPGSGWFLDYVLITTDGASINEAEYFPCFQWLDEGEGDGKTCRTVRKMGKS